MKKKKTPQNQEDICIKKNKIKKLSLLFVLCILFVYLGYCVGGYYEWKSAGKHYEQRFKQECLLPNKERFGEGEYNLFPKQGTMPETGELGKNNETNKS